MIVFASYCVFTSSGKKTSNQVEIVLSKWVEQLRFSNSQCFEIYGVTYSMESLLQGVEDTKANGALFTLPLRLEVPCISFLVQKLQSQPITQLKPNGKVCQPVCRCDLLHFCQCFVQSRCLERWASSCNCPFLSFHSELCLSTLLCTPASLSCGRDVERA